MSDVVQSSEDIKFIETKEVLLSKIKFDKNNPNKLSKEKQIGLDKTVSKYGFAVDPWLNDLGDGSYLVIDGEHRIRLLLDKGIKSTKCKIFKVKYVEVQMLRQIANKLRGEHDTSKDTDEFKAILDNNNLTKFAEMIGESEEVFRNIITQADDLIFKPDKSIDDTITEGMDNFSISFHYENIADYEHILQKLKLFNKNKELALLKLVGE